MSEHTTMDGVWECRQCNLVGCPSLGGGPVFRWAGDRWQHWHDGQVGHCDMDYVDIARLRARVAELETFLAACCDDPADRMYHAKDGTWWRRKGLRWKAADAPDAITAERDRLRASVTALEKERFAYFSALCNESTDVIERVTKSVLANRDTSPVCGTLARAALAARGEAEK